MFKELKRKEDEKTIKEAMYLLVHECSEHKKCVNCKLYGEGLESNCILDHPPAVWDIDTIITKMFHMKH